MKCGINFAYMHIRFYQYNLLIDEVILELGRV